MLRLLGQDRNQKLHRDYVKSNEAHWKVSHSKQRSFNFNRTGKSSYLPYWIVDGDSYNFLCIEREIEIERDNMKLLRKLEEIKRKGDVTG